MLVGAVSRMVESTEMLARLNMQAVRSTLDDTHRQSCQALSLQREPFLRLLHGRQVFAIIAEAQESGPLRARAVGSVCQTGENADGRHCEKRAGRRRRGLEVDQALNATTALYESLERTGQQAVDVTRSNFDVTAARASQSGRRAVGPLAQAAKG
ncbi:hypothetical protein [Paraburkholderia hospita]|uniref:hypothetical protein n=1 Tax=Paraburkholderia hospita TaxID=169430 RepID=UPI000DEFB3BC|nr:hypothetical protein [Paraburkholderia hospita]